MFQNTPNMCFKDTKWAKFLWMCNSILNYWDAVNFGLRWVQLIIVLATGVLNQIKFTEVTKAILAVTSLPAIFSQNWRMGKALENWVGKTSVAHVDVARKSLQLKKLLNWSVGLTNIGHSFFRLLFLGHLFLVRLQLNIEVTGLFRYWVSHWF